MGDTFKNHKVSFTKYSGLTTKCQKMKNKPNLPPHDPNMQNKPNSTRPTAKKCETNPISSRCLPKCAKRTQFAPAPLPKYAKQTQFTPTATRPTTQIRETNPISVLPPSPILQNKPNYRRAHEPKMRNKPNFHRAGPVEDQECETNPIPAYQVSQRSLFQRNEPIKTTPDAIGPPLYLTLTEVGDWPTTQIRETNPIYPHGHPTKSPNTRNEPNLPHDHPAPHQKCETNPIYRPAGVSLAFPPRITRNKPNLPPRWRLAGFPTPYYAKQTQFAAPRPKYAKQTQFPLLATPILPCWPKVSPDSSGNPIPRHPN